ncbi:hypothetical protein AB0J80_38300 [Actinoplanes sp. NPDC049548]|uniref:zinc-dependent metalloprotease family protein n=1 Tax=Actinoplanes sp. NPDC049548 TaxID=3155152 RepID=UPI003431B924
MGTSHTFRRGAALAFALVAGLSSSAVPSVPAQADHPGTAVQAAAATTPRALIGPAPGRRDVHLADGVAGGKVVFKALKGIKPGIGYKAVTGTHTVQVYPLYAAAAPSSAALKSALAQVRAYYTRELPGVTFRFTLRGARKVPRDRACTSDFGYLRTVAKTQSMRARHHVLGWGFGCGGNYGWADQAPGRGYAWVHAADYPDASVVAHELGHNLGLYHANAVGCRTSSGASTPLSARCSEYEYSDPWDSQGNVCQLADCHVSGVAQALLAGKTRTRVISASRTTDIRLVVSGTTGTRTALVRTSYGDLFFDMHTKSTVMWIAGDEPGVNVRLATAHGQGLLGMPDHRDRMGDDSDSILALGDRWTIPGSKGLRVIVTAVGPRSATLRFLPVKSDTTPPTTPHVSAPAETSEGSLPITWTAATDARGIAAYLVESNDRVVARLPSTSRSYSVGATNLGAKVRIIAIDRSGNRATSAALTVTRPTEDPVG